LVVSAAVIAGMPPAELPPGIPITIHKQLREREAEEYHDRATRRLEKSVIRTREVKFEIVVPPQDPPRGKTEEQFTNRARA
jgi:hypothetical protein